MHGDYPESVKRLIAHLLAEQTNILIASYLRRYEGCDEYVNLLDYLYPAIHGGMKLVEQQLSEPRNGTMTFEQAMGAAIEGKMITRPHWDILRAVTGGALDQPDVYASFVYRGHTIDQVRLDSGGNTASGEVVEYEPTEDDLAATDWMEHQPIIYGSLQDLDDGEIGSGDDD